MAELTVNSVLTPWQRFECINKRCKIVPVLLRVAHDSFLRVSLEYNGNSDFKNFLCRASKSCAKVERP